MAADELLPPIEPPSAGFILQLFVVPAAIVLFIMMVWLLFGWLASGDEADVDAIVAALGSSTHARWQKANELAGMLQMDRRYPKLKENRHLAAELARMLDEQVEVGLSDSNSVDMRYFLCRALGEFRVDDGLAVLLKTAREDKHRDVRREAIKALAVLGNTFATMEPPRELEQAELTETLLKLANDQDDLIRSETAFCLGVFSQGKNANAPLVEELKKLADDLHADTRYNAALALARSGNLHAVGVVAEMLDLDSIAISIAGEQNPRQQAFKRNIILHNALTAAVTLKGLNPQLDFPELREAVQAFLDAAPTAIESEVAREKLMGQAERALETLSR